MKRLLAAAVVAIGSTTCALAADMAVKSAAVARPTCAAAQWSGLYAGINGGGALHTAYRLDSTGLLPANNTNASSSSSWGGTVGGQVGYNFVSCSTFWGVEADGAWLSNDRFVRSLPGVPLEIGGVTARLDGLVTLRARGGVALDNMLLYVTGGGAALHTRTNYGHVHADNTVNEQANVNDWTWGWVAGFGAEYALSPNLSFRSEFLYVGTPDKDYRVRSFGTISVNRDFTQHDNLAIARVGLNYRFSAPVVAKY